MNQEKRSNNWRELSGAMIVGAVINALIFLLYGIGVYNRLCPGWLLIILLFMPVLLSKAPMEVHYFWFSEYGRSEEKFVRIAAIFGGYIGMVLMFLMALCLIMLNFLILISRT